MIKKIILMTIVLISTINAGEIFRNYSYDQDKASIRNLEKIEKPILFKNQESMTAYQDNEDFTLIFQKTERGERLRFVQVLMIKFDLKEEIERTLKSGFRLKKIVLTNKYGKQNVQNVGDLIRKINIEKDKATIFNTVINANLLFQQEKAIMIMDYNTAINRTGSGCKTCDELKGTNLEEKAFLTLLFTEKTK